MFRTSVLGDWLRVRRRLLILTSSMFFSGIFFSAAVHDWLSPHPPLYLPPKFPAEGNVPLLIFGVFTSNIVLSAFTLVTLPGFALFPLPLVSLAFRAYIWGFMLANQLTWLLLAAMPTIVLEGLGYCFAASAGTVAGGFLDKAKMGLWR